MRNAAEQVDPQAYISGKHFLFPLFAKYFRQKFPFKGSNGELMVHLARGFERSA